MGTGVVTKAEKRRLRVADIRAIAQLLTHATRGITNVTEGVHQAVRASLGLRAGNGAARTAGITGLVYHGVRGVTRLTGASVDTALVAVQALLEPTELPEPESLQREALLAALNGVMGDRLRADRNAFAIPMTLRYENQPLSGLNSPPLPEKSGKVLLLIHGLCMNDLHRHAQRQGQAASHGQALAEQLGYTPIYLRYNSGRHVSQNGQDLARLLEQSLQAWPTAIEELSVVAHSMGGLLIRSALHIAQQQDMLWPAHLKKIVFLGTPHHGAPLERMGNWVDVILGSMPYTRPFRALGQLRSAGITDLRYGNMCAEDWHDQDRFERQSDRRQAVPLPHDVACFAIAATTAQKRTSITDRLTGDGLVPLNSALGDHEEPRYDLDFPRDKQWIAYRTGHLQLLTNPAVTQQLLLWLKPSPVSGMS